MRPFTKALAILAGLGPTASAQPRPGRGDLARQFDQCSSLLTRLRAAESVECWRAVRAQSDAPAVVYSLGMALRAAGRPRAAIATFEEFLARAGDDRAMAEYARRAAEAVREMSASLGRLELTTEPAGASASLDGEPLPPGASVEVDPGEHSLHVQAPGHVAEARRVRILPGRTERVHVALPTPPTSAGPWPWVVVGVGALALASLAPLQVAYDDAIAAQYRINQACGARLGCSDAEVRAMGWHDADDRAGTFTTLRNVAIGVGAAGVAAGALWYVLDRARRPTAAARAPWPHVAASPTGWSVGVRGAL